MTVLPSLPMNRPAALREYRWRVAPAAPPDSPLLSAGDTLHPVLGRILHNRGLTHPAQAQAFLSHHYLLSRDPFQLADMDRAADRIIRAPVSYTHLDVYKRQFMLSFGPNARMGKVRHVPLFSCMATFTSSISEHAFCRSIW